ncbi:hypothetical protein ACFFON_14670 [Arthrobacter citreus]|uniref:hypothetical protein n=1 Tax=Arthrobacter TaxID=1663 RepID=UPI0031B5F067
MNTRRSAVPAASAVPATSAPSFAAPPFAAPTPFARIRRLLNLINLSTPAGLALARAAKCRITRGPDGLLLAGGWTWPLPRAAAFTVGNVILYRSRAASSFRPAHRGPLASGLRTVGPSPSRLLRHESRHSTQYAALGPAFLPLYFLAAGISRLRTGDPASGNIFERLAGLEDGGYRRPA